MDGTFQVTREKCEQCLFSPHRIVSGTRAKQVIEDALAGDGYFICHKATIAGKDVCCRGFFETFKYDSLATRAAVLFNVVEFVDVEQSERETYAE